MPVLYNFNFGENRFESIKLAHLLLTTTAHNFPVQPMKFIATNIVHIVQECDATMLQQNYFRMAQKQVKSGEDFWAWQGSCFVLLLRRTLVRHQS